MAAPYAKHKLYWEPDGDYSRLEKDWATSDPLGSKLMGALNKLPQTDWVGEYGGRPGDAVARMLDKSGEALRVFVVYAIPDRDLGAYSAGGVADAKAYRAYIDDFARGVAGRLCLVNLEPDALPMAVDDMSPEGQKLRAELLAYAVDKLTDAGARPYLDSGDSNWVSAKRMAEILLRAGVERAAGVGLNFAHTEYVDDELVYLQELRRETGLPNLRAIIDTSRAGRGAYKKLPTEPSTASWANPPGRGLGPRPTLRPGASWVAAGCDALVIGKRCGSSDGEYRGAPKAGTMWAPYAREIALNAIPPLLPHRDLVG